MSSTTEPAQLAGSKPDTDPPKMIGVLDLFKYANPKQKCGL